MGDSTCRLNRRRLQGIGPIAVLLLVLAVGVTAAVAQEGARGRGRPAKGGLAPVVLKAVVWRSSLAEVRLSATNADGVVQELPVVSDQPYEVFLFEPGPWIVRPAAGSGFWGREIVVESEVERGGSGASETDDGGVADQPQAEAVPLFEIPVFPAVSASGRVVGPQQPGGQISILLGDVDAEHSDPRFRLRGVRIRCPVGGDGRWTCDLPGALAHVVFWRPEYSPEYRWETPLFGRAERNLGDQVLVRGASLAGFVAPAPGFRELMGRCVVQVATADPTVWRTGLEDLVASVDVARDGFFQAVGLQAGNHWVQVDCNDRVAARAGPFRLRRNAETFERKRIPLTGRHFLDLTVRPEEPPYESHWVATLRQIPPEDEEAFWRLHRRGEYPQQRAIVEDGRVRFHVPGDGAFRVEILDAAGGRFGGLDYLEVVSDRTAVVELDFVPVVGRLLLDEDPLSGLVFFGGRGASPELTFTTDDEGWFRGSLPKPDGWRVDVFAPEQGLAQLFHEVGIEPGEPLILRLWDTTVEGSVVTASTGEPVRFAVVRFESADGLLMHQASSGRDGRYSARGVPPGPVRILAGYRGTARAVESFETVLGPRQTMTVDFMLPDEHVPEEVREYLGLIPPEVRERLPPEVRERMGLRPPEDPRQ